MGVFAVLTPVHHVSAQTQQDTLGLSAVGQTVNLSGTDPRTIAVRIINISLGFIGIILVVMVMYAGFTWMTAGGATDKIDRAKAILRNAVIGLVIVLSAWGITSFVIRSLLDATGGSGTGASGSGGGSGGGFGSGGSTIGFQVSGISPSGQLTLRNVVVRIVFTRDINPTTFSANIVKISDDTTVNGNWTVSGRTASFVPTTPCPEPNQDRFCFDETTAYRVTVASSVKSVSDQTLTCGGFAPECTKEFITGALVDTAPPTVKILSPLSGSVYTASDNVSVTAEAKDDSSISIIEMYLDDQLINISNLPAGQTVTEATMNGLMGLQTATPGTHRITAKAYDADSNSTLSSAVSIVVRPAHCANGIKDGDETDIDCGGSCGLCSGSACTTNEECSSGACINNQCVDKPRITDFSPKDGRAGTVVQISGRGFGTTPGKVRFANGVEASPAQVCLSSGVTTWTPYSIMVEVPEGAVNGPIEVEHATNQLKDSSNDTNGPILDVFTVNAVAHPVLCQVAPNSGQQGDRIELRGAGFGSSAGQVYFDDREISTVQSWSDSAIVVNTPVFTPKIYQVTLKSAGVDSNASAFRIDERVLGAAPTLSRVTPESGPIGQYITLTGTQFGASVGKVFIKRADGIKVLADTSFPQACGVGFWSDTSITVKVPQAINAGIGNEPLTPGNYSIYIERTDAQSSNELPFAVQSGTPTPGLCAVRPAAGPIGTTVGLVGEYLGSSGSLTFAGDGTARVNASVANGQWNQQAIAAAVPVGAKSGAVIVEVGGKTSNPVQFAVESCSENPAICGTGEQCCSTGACSVGGVCPRANPTAHYAWKVSTGQIPTYPYVIEECHEYLPSPSPWNGHSGSNLACTNAMGLIRFSTRLDESTVNAQTIEIRKCTGQGTSPCDTLSDPIQQLAGFPRVNNFSEDQDYLQFLPATKSFDELSTYRVIVKDGVLSSTGMPLAPKPECGTNAVYCFDFTTREASNPCKLAAIRVLPERFTMKDINQVQHYSLSALASGESCMTMNLFSLESIGINWTVSDGRASITSKENPYWPGLPDFEQDVTGLAETGSDPVGVKLDISVNQDLYTDTAELFIKTQPPKVLNYGPNCQTACSNAALWIEFSEPMMESSLQNTFEIQQCTNENCITFSKTWSASDLSPITLTVVPGAVDQELRFAKMDLLDRTGQTILERGKFYRAFVRGGSLDGARSLNGLFLTELNHPDGFEWTFRVKDTEDPTCAVGSVSVTPLKKIEIMVGARQSFSAVPKTLPDSCSKTGQILTSNQSFQWTLQQAGQVSRYVNGGTGAAVGAGTIDTSPVRVSGCGNRCTELGSTGIAGKTASCGNRVVETKNNQYCRNAAGTGACASGATDCRTIFGDSCRLLDADAVGGEECDEGNETAGCSSRCLWKPSTSSSCGNGVIDRGEQCDPGASGTPGCSQDCQVLGSIAGDSTCGNNDIARGESCDDGNGLSGDGCSAICRNEGSAPVIALCGNGIREAGETCEKSGSVWPAAGCDAKTCLVTGTDACGAQGTLCCGNNRVDAGETCDDGNELGGDGCSQRCIKEGSHIGYVIPSFCGDGIVGTGESAQCETAGGDGKQDSLQLAEIVGNGTPDAVGIMTSAIQSSFGGKMGTAQYGVQCGKATEAECPVGTGLDQYGCCASRPNVMLSYPISGAIDVCRNTAITVTFNTEMNPDTLQTNLIVAEKVAGASCPAGSQILSVQRESASRLGRVWESVRVFFGRPAKADVYCSGIVKGSLTTSVSGGRTTAEIDLEKALKPNTEYRVFVRGDANLTDNPASKAGVQSTRGVVMSGDRGWVFKTGPSICAISAVRVIDQNIDSPALFTTANETHRYKAQPVSIQDGKSVLLSSVDEYNWSWQPFNSSDENILTVAPVANDDLATDVTSKALSGTSYISAELKIINDDVQQPSTENSIVRGTLLSTVMLCQQPWPSRELGAFADVAGSAALTQYAPGIASSGPYFNFSTLYCRDGETQSTTDDDLPIVRATPVERTTADIGLGVLRQYLLSFDSTLYPELAGDGIGIRVMTNPLHLNVLDWYRSRGFTGTPKEIVIDGYEALSDGSTVYVSAANTEAPTNEKVYPNVYIISRNPNAKEQTQEIFDQIVKNFVLNANLQDDVQNSCVYALPTTDNQPADNTLHASGETYRDNGVKVTCTADWECLKKNTNTRCASFKPKLQRDLKRISDFSRLTNQLEETKAAQGSYPTLNSGSFIQGMSTSRWPSWGTVFGEKAKADPVNRYLSCGYCSRTQSACVTNADCATDEQCQAPAGQSGLEASTCWNALSQRYVCPVLNPQIANASVSRIYQYRSINNGTRFELGTELESVQPDLFFPPLLSEAKSCSNLDSQCSKDSDCNVYNLQTGAVLSTGQCLAMGGSWKYSGICQGVEYGQDDVCGNGVIGPNEICELGDTRPATCTLSGGAAGTKIQICNNCQAFTDSSVTTCIAQSICGNGRIDRAQCLNGEGKKYGQSCLTPGSVSECLSAGDPQGTGIICTALPIQELCDDGTALNGTYGHCNRSCTGYDNYCGDGKLSAGESCDNQGANGNYCGVGCSIVQSCSSGCDGVAPYCGDGIVQSEEACDGGIEYSSEGCEPQKYCTVKNSSGNQVACLTDGDCDSLGTGATCATYQTHKFRTCQDRGTASQCTYNAWSVCQVKGSCGDGIVDEGEQCDDGNTSNGDTCTNACKTNICGDGYRQSTSEECDYGAQNGQACPSGAEYGTNCLACSTQCKQVAQSGGYCGNGRVDGPEQCDGTLFRDANATCKTLGYDLAKETNPNGSDKISCNASCQYAGCMRCSDAVGDGTISGQVMDAVYSFAPVPNARVTLYSRGVRVKDVLADKDGKFTFTNIVTQAACSNYKIVVDMYQDNSCTGSIGRPTGGCNGKSWLTGFPSVNEGEEGGYWPYESNTFSALKFKEDGIQNTEGKIFLIPRVKDGETLAVHTWKGSYSYHDAHLVLPQDLSFKLKSGSTAKLTSPTYKFHDYDRCLIPDGPGCGRDVHWGATFQGNPDLTVVPHANLYCYSGSNTISLSCNSFDTSPQTIKFKYNAIDNGNYRLILDDYSSISSSYLTFGSKTSGTVRVVTKEHVYQISAPIPTSAPCTSSDGKSGKYWYVFEQKAGTGEVTVKNTYHCEGQPNPFNPDVNLPTPMTSTGS